MTHEEIDAMWQQAMRQSIEAGEIYTRYHFAKLVAEKALAQEKALQALHAENERLGLYKDAYAEPVAHDPLPRACNLAGVDYQTFLKIKAYMPVHATTPPQRTWLTDEDISALLDEPERDEPPPQRTEQNFCSRCGKRTPDLTHIHTCTPPKENT